MAIRVLERVDENEWASALENYKYSLFITPTWVESFRGNNFTPVYLDFLEGDTIVAKISGISIGKTAAINNKLVCYAGPAIQSSVTSKEIIGECLDVLVSYAKGKRYSRLLVLSYDYPVDSHHHAKFAFYDRVEFVVDLSRSEQEVYKSVSRNIKRNVKKAENCGYKMAEYFGEDACDQLTRLMEETKKTRLSKGYHDYQYFYLPHFDKTTLFNLAESGGIRFFQVEKEGEMHALLTVMIIGQRAYGLFIGVTSDGYRDGVPSFLDYSVMMLLKERNFEYFNFGGVPTDGTHSGLVSFKERLGAVGQKSIYGSTNFLLFPYNILNPLINLARKIPDNKMIRYVKKYL